jgi:hypothetical protein
MVRGPRHLFENLRVITMDILMCEVRVARNTHQIEGRSASLGERLQSRGIGPRLRKELHVTNHNYLRAMNDISFSL